MRVEIDLRVRQRRREFFDAVGRAAARQLVGDVLGVIVSQFHPDIARPSSGFLKIDYCRFNTGATLRVVCIPLSLYLTLRRRLCRQGRLTVVEIMVRGSA